MGRKLFLVSMSSNPLWSGSSNFSRSLVFFRSFVKFGKSASSGFRDHCPELTATWSLGGEEIVYSLLYILISIIIIISSSISFVA